MTFGALGQMEPVCDKHPVCTEYFVTRLETGKADIFLYFYCAHAKHFCSQGRVVFFFFPPEVEAVTVLPYVSC